MNYVLLAAPVHHYTSCFYMYSLACFLAVHNRCSAGPAGVSMDVGRLSVYCKKAIHSNVHNFLCQPSILEVLHILKSAHNKLYTSKPHNFLGGYLTFLTMCMTLIPQNFPMFFLSVGKITAHSAHI